MRTFQWFPILAAAVLFAACGGGGGSSGTSSDGNPSGSSLRVLATDAPFPFDDVIQANVRIQRIELRDAGSGSFLTLTDFSASGGKVIDLVDLRNGAVEELFSGDPVPGSYDLVRIIVEAESITIDDGGTEKTFTDFKVPSGPQTGVKVFIDPPIDVVSSLTTDLVLDFDLAGSFVVQGNPSTPAGIKGFHFKPVIRAVNASTAGTLTFRVRSDNGTPGDTTDDFFLNGATWTARTTAEPVDVVASGSSGPNPDDASMEGYVFHPAVPAGGYDLEVEAPGYDSYEQGIVIAAANLTDLGTILLARSLTELSGVVTTTIQTTTGESLEMAVAGASVSATPDGGSSPFGTDETNTAGQYAISGIPTGLYDLQVSLEGYETANGSADLGAGGEDFVTVDFPLVAKTADIAGTVRDGGGNLVSGATVQATLFFGGGEKVIATTTTDTNGAYTLSGVPTGSYTIRATSSTLTDSVDIDHVGGGAATTQDLTVE